MAVCNVIVDLSHNNPTVDFARAKAAGIVGVIHKATQGTGFVDPAYTKRRKAANEAGLLWGAYHFGTGSDPTRQVQSFLKVADPAAVDLVVLDFESNTTTPGNDMGLEQARSFINAVNGALGSRIGIYGGAFLKETLGSSSDATLRACWLWWAQYGPAPRFPSNWDAFTLWQYTNGHHGNPPFAIDGIGTCDRDIYQGSSGDLQTKWTTGTLS